MRTRRRILPYKATSASARALARATNTLRVRLDGSRYSPRTGDVVLNWGYSGPYPQEWDRLVRFINHPKNVEIARDKRKTLELLHHNGVPTVEWTRDIDVALQWFSHGDVVVQRNTATGQGGSGIVLCDPKALTVNAPDPRGALYTKYFKKKQEFRVHVWGNDVLDIQEKKKRRGKDVDTKIRSYGNGWVFCREGVVCPEAVSLAAVAAVEALGLDFGAVDIGWNQKKELPAVFEVNTAPGVEGSTVGRYAEAMLEGQTEGRIFITSEPQEPSND